MVVLAIVGILSAVGLPALTKAQDKAKDSTAIAKLTNAGKECASSLVTAEDGSIYEKGSGAIEADKNNNIDASDTTGRAAKGVSGDCEVDDALTGLSVTTRKFDFVFVDGIPGKQL